MKSALFKKIHTLQLPIRSITVLLINLFCAQTSFAVVDTPPAINYIQASDTTITVFDPMSRPVGTISPDPDGSGPLPRQATRTFYNPTTALVDSVETGTLTGLPFSNQPPADWSGFSRVSKQVFGYDTYGRKTTTTVYGNNTQALSLTQVNYDGYSRVYCQAVRMNPAAYTNLPDACSLGSEGAEGPDRISKFTYDEYDQITSQRKAVGTSLEQTYVVNEYLGHYLTRQTDANQNRTDLRYGPGWRLERMVFPSPNVINAVNESDYVHFEYDANGNKIKERKRNGAEVNYTLDANNRVIVKDYVNNAKQADVYFDYDARGLLLSSRFNSAAGVGITNSFDGFGRLKTSTNNQGTSRTLNYAYDANSNRTQITHPDGQVFSYSFDGLNRVQGVADSATANNNLLSLTYQANGRRQNLTRNGSAGGVTAYTFNNGVQLNNFQQSFVNSTNNLSTDFTYNKAGQITTLTQSNSAYFYTGNENRTGDYTPNGLNQYKSIGGQDLTYDTNGNLTNDVIKSYTYDDENRLLTVNNPNTSFVYDPNGRLFQVTIAGTSRQFLYDGDALVAEYAADGSTLKRYVHGDQVDEPWLQYIGSSVTATNRRYLHSDHQGSIIAQSDNTGGVLTKFAYDGYGIPATANNDTFGYTGQVYFKELGLNYYKARFYSPKLGRFLQTDPIGYKDDMNLYAYVGNDPVNGVDPTGKFVILLAIPFIETAITFTATELVVGAVAGTAIAGGAVLATSNSEPDKGESPSSDQPEKNRNKVEPVKEAEGPHSTWKEDKEGNKTRTQSYNPNPRNPSGHDEVKSVDLQGKPHRNKETGESVPTPHAQGREDDGTKIPGGVRPALPEEIPK